MNSDLKINVGDYEVFDSGVVISHDLKDILFEVKSLKIKIVFETNSDNNAYEAKKSFVENNTCLVLKLTNFSNPLGLGLTSPMEVGRINDKKLFLQFIVYSLGNNNTKMLAYTWLTKKEDA